MTSFTAAGRTWNLEVSIPTRKAVKDATNGEVDLFAAFDATLYTKLADPATLVDVLWAMCEEQAGNVTVNEFARAFRGDLIEHASDALQEAIALFFPSRQSGLLMK